MMVIFSIYKNVNLLINSIHKQHQLTILYLFFVFFLNTRLDNNGTKLWSSKFHSYLVLFRRVNQSNSYFLLSFYFQLVLVLGDLHIPDRAAGIPAAFQKMLVPGKMQHILCTGNVGSPETVAYLKTIAPNVHIVRGDFDHSVSGLPETKVVTIGNFKIGLCHGHQIVPWGDDEALAILQRKLGVDILITGHTHRNTTRTYESSWFLNPGSMTGAYSSLQSETVPSFILMSIKDDQVTNYVYELHKGKDNATVYTNKFSRSAE